MRLASKYVVIAVTVVASSVVAPVVVGNAAASPSVTVSPHARLVGGQTVHVTGSGITPNASVAVNECEDYFFNPDADCNDLTTTTASSTGTVAMDVTVSDLVYRNIERGDPIPDYCRADGCHLFLIWTDTTGTQVLAQSVALQFQGAPANIHVRPSTNLLGTQRVTVNGSAYGAFGQQVQILEEACFQTSEGSGCYDPKAAVTTRVSSSGTWSVSYQVHRHLSDGNVGDPELDCADTGNILGHCEMTVVVIGADGQPDPSFGDPRLGEPAVPLTFHAQPTSG